MLNKECVVVFTYNLLNTMQGKVE